MSKFGPGFGWNPRRWFSYVYGAHDDDPGQGVAGFGNRKTLRNMSNSGVGEARCQSFDVLIPILIRMGQLWRDEMVAEHESRQPSEIEPPASSSVWINDADLLFRDLLRGALAHLLGVIRHRIFRGAPSTYSLGDQLIWAEFNRQLAEPKPALGPDASEIEKWMAADLDPFEGIKCYRA